MKATSKFLVVAIVLLVSTALAGTENSDYKATPPPSPESWCVTPPDTEFRIGIPGWIAGLSGDFGVKGVVTDQDVKFTDILKRLDMLARDAWQRRSEHRHKPPWISLREICGDDDFKNK
jgi:hypothetical protein